MNPNLKPGPGRKRSPTGEIGKLFDQLLTEKNWTMRHYADVLGLPYQRVQEYVARTHRPSLSKLRELLAPFGLSADIAISIKKIDTEEPVQVIWDEIG